MDLHSFQENWSIVCRKFPLVCFIAEPSDKIVLEKTILSHCSQFDHVVFFYDQDHVRSDIQKFSEKNRVINLTSLKSSDIPGNNLIEKALNASKGQIILVTSRLESFEKNIRWKIYDKIKEMKSPLTDVVNLNVDLNYCKCEDAFITAQLRLS